jgi:S1-C subfamily serine protease
MDGMTTLDWLIIAFCLAMAVWGSQSGLIVGALSLVGFVAGAFAGSRIGPELLADGAHSPYAPLVTLLGGLLVGGIAGLGMEGVARAIYARVVRGRASFALDGVGGAALFFALGLGLAWLFGAVALNTPGLADVRKSVQRSEILSRLNERFPPAGVIKALNRIDPTPQIRGPEADVSAPDPKIASDPEVEIAGRSVVQVLGTACGLGIAGSGWVAAPGVVATNAHVIAGQDDTTVTTSDGAELGATPVHYDPRNDFALLQVDGYPGEPLPLAPRARKGAQGAVLGYPEAGPYTVSPARVGTTAEVISEDAYGRGPVRREMTAFRAELRSGNSGGPLVDADGVVETTVFAASAGSKPPSGLGVPNQIVRRALGKTGGEVGTGPCAR